MANPSIALLPSAYKAEKLYTQLPVNGDGDFLVDRASVGTRVNAQGLIEEVAIDEPRINYLDTYKYRNLLDYSENVEGWYSNWALGRSTTDIVGLPSPLTDADTIKLGSTSSSGSHLISFTHNNTELEDSTNYCWSFYIKAGTSSRVGISFKDKNNSFTTNVFEISTLSWIGSAGSVDRGYEVLENGWIRLWQLDGTSTGATIPTCAIYQYDTNGNLSHADDSMYFYYTGMQFEKADSPSEYQPKLTGNEVLSYSEISACPHLLLEPQSTNLITYSEDLSNGAWAKNNGAINSLSDVNPKGEASSYEWVMNIGADGTLSSSLNAFRNSVTVTNGVAVTFSIFAKAKGYDTIKIYDSNQSGDKTVVDLTNGEQTDVSAGFITKVTDYLNGWYRIECTRTMTSTTWNMNITANEPSADGASGILLWGGQMEEAAYSTSYIKTEASSVTRLGDICNSSGNVSTFNSAEGVLYCEMAALFDDGTSRNISLSDGTNSNRIYLYYSSTSETLSATVYNGSLVVNISYVLTDSTDFIKVGFKYKLNDFALWVNGVEVATDISGTTFGANTLNELQFAQYGGSNDFYGKVRDLRVFQTALTDTELTTLTTL